METNTQRKKVTLDELLGFDAVVTPRLPIYCTECQYYEPRRWDSGRCSHPKNLRIKLDAITSKENRRIHIDSPEEINQRNDCAWFDLVCWAQQDMNKSTTWCLNKLPEKTVHYWWYLVGVVGVVLTILFTLLRR